VDLIRFALLGLGAGSIYALTGQGIVLVYRGSGVLNFAHGAFGMIGAFWFYLWRDDGMATPPAMALALAVGAVMGAATHLLVMRPLRGAPALARLIATLGLLTVGLAFGLERWGDSPRIVAKLLPVDPVDLGADLVVGRDRLILFGIAAAASVVLMAVYRWTRFGLATTAVAEDQRNLALVGVSPDLVATCNWALGSMLAVAGAVLIVNITGLQVVGLTLLVVPGLAAALVGGFRSFPLTLAGGMLIGVLESEVAYAQTKVSDPTLLEGWGRAVPFAVIIVVLTVRGRSLPLRSDRAERPPEVGAGRPRPLAATLVTAGTAGLLAFALSERMVEAVTTSAVVAIVVLSLTVVTGYAGQLSLAQFALAGTGAWMASRLVVNYDLPFEVAALIGIVGTVPIGVVVGLPALRTRGVNLAVVTLGLALVLESLILNNSTRTGGITGTQIGSPTFFGFDLDTTRYPERYSLMALGCLVVVAVAVANLRRGRVGRRLVAVRSNERAAAALGISVTGVKLYAFGLSAAIAAIGGVLMAYRRPTVVFYPTFSVFESILVIVYGVIGGIGFVLGALFGAVLAPGGLLPVASGDLLENGRVVQLVLGVLVIGVLLWRPDGLASLGWRRMPLLRRFAKGAPAIDVEADGRLPAIRPTSLHVEDLTVRFGGVTAVDGLSLHVAPGEVVGLIGPNGAGKSTAIDAVTGFTRGRGEVRIGDHDVQTWSPRRRAAAGLSRSFQQLELFETMTVRENLLAACERRDGVAYLTDLVRPGRAELGAAARAAIRDFDLAEDLDRRPDELPYARRRLVALARAVATEPSVLLLDEPAAGLGDADTAELGRLVRRLADEWGIAVLLVEHNVSIVLEVCDRVVVLDAGVKIAEGTPTEVRDDIRVVEAYLGAGEVAPTAPATPATAASGVPLLAAVGLHAGYGELAAVHDLDLEVYAGEVVALLGANGAGKTTTLLTLAGELTPLSGQVRWRGEPAPAGLHRRAAAGTSLVPEERGVVRSLTVGENLRLARVDATDALELFPELEPLLGRRVGLLSGGEQQMLSLAVALGRHPEVLLADELSLGLAPLVVERLLRALRRAADDGVAVLVVEQHVRQVLEVADRAVILRRGIVELAGTAAEMRVRPEQLERAYLPG
jgi:sulfate-transporting ATPase